MKNYIFLFLILLLASCESQEDTYEDFVGDGDKRYVGKCYDLEVSTGWHRFQLSWQNSIDPTIENIKIVWSTDNVKDSVIIAGDQTSWESEAVFNDNNVYVFDVYAVNDLGEQSIKTGAYGKAYSFAHEEVIIYGKAE